MQGPGGPSLFVGRVHEVQRLQRGFEAAMRGQGSVALLAGEPGIGKTTVCRELAAWVTDQGGLALLGQCDDAGVLSVPYLPFIETLSTAVRARRPADLVREVGAYASDLTQLVPDLRDRLPDVAMAAASADPVDARYRLLQAVTGFLTAVAASVPILLILEDLQDADRGTLDLFGHLSRHLADARILIVGTFRTTEVDRTHPLAQSIALARRRIAVDRLQVDGLSPAEVQHLVDGIAGEALPARVGAEVYAQSDGNPLFVWEIMRQQLDAARRSWGTTLGQTARAPWDFDHVPDGLRDAIGIRLTRLSSACQRVLTVAAVIGREFTLGTIQGVAGLSEEQVTRALAEAVRAAVLREHVQVGGVRYQFAHALFRQTLYADLTAAERLRLHPQVARVLEQQHGVDDVEHAGALAEHFARSMAPDDLRKALAYSRRAAAYATRVYASAEAARLLGHALAIQQAVAPDDLPLRCDLLIEQGEALLDAGEARRALDEIATPAFALAERLNDPTRASAVCALAMACFQNAGSSYALASPESASWAQRANRWAQPGTVTRVWADAFLGVQGYFRERWNDGLPLLRRALDGARMLGDLETLWWMRWLWVGYANSPQYAADQLRVAEEIAALPRDGVSARTLGYALSWTAATFLAQGERARADAIWQELVDLAARSGQPVVQVHAFRGPATLALYGGRLEEAAAIAEQSIAYGLETGLPDHGQGSATQIGLRPLLMLGRYDDAMRIAEPGSIAFTTLALAYLGRHQEVRAQLDEAVMARPDFGTERDVTQQHMDVFRLEAAVLVDHGAAAARLLDRLAPLSHVTTGVRVPTCVSRHLGSAAALLGRHDEALAHYQAALTLAQAMRFRPELALIRLGLAELLAASFPDRRTEAAEHLGLVLPELRAMGMAPALARAERLAERIAPSDAAPADRAGPDGLTPRELEVLRLVAAGKSNAEIAEALVMSVRTAERHLANIYAKLGTSGPAARAAAVAYAHTRSLVPSSRA